MLARVTASLVLAAAWQSIYAQELLPSGSGTAQAGRVRLEMTFRDPKPKETLACKVQPLAPVLNFAFRHQAGFRASVPLTQLEGDHSPLLALFRVVPEQGGEAFYFRQTFRVPTIPPRRGSGLELMLSGGFFLGEGKYKVEWALFDSRNRVCREDWKLELKAKDAERASARFMRPGEAAPLILNDWVGSNDGAPRPYRIAVLLHAAPLFSRSMNLSRFTQSLLLTTLGSLFEKTPFVETSVTAFNMNQQKEIFRTERLDGRSFHTLVKAMDDLDLGTIDFEVLKRPTGHLEMLAKLVNREMSSANPPHAIVFIGPNTREEGKFPKQLLEAVPREHIPQFFYLHQDYYRFRHPWADPIEKLVNSQDGKMFRIIKPEELAKAIREMERKLEVASGIARPAVLPPPTPVRHGFQK